MQNHEKYPLTPSQTVGPFFTIGLSSTDAAGGLASPVTHEIAGEGEEIRIRGRVMDGNGDPVPDAMIEIWQADSKGSFTNSEFMGFARSETGAGPDHCFQFKTIKPAAASSLEAPYISVIVYMRGLLTQAYTRLYFSDEAEANSRDIVLSELPDARKDTLLAKSQQAADGLGYEFDICMQGDFETVFFSV